MRPRAARRGWWTARPAVTITGVTGQTAINGTWVISNVTPAPGNGFALVGIAGNGTKSSGGNFAAVKTTGIDVQKAGRWHLVTPRLCRRTVNSPSPFDSTKFNLVSGGTVYSIDTTSTSALRPWARRPSRAFFAGASPFQIGGWNVMESCQQRRQSATLPDRDHHHQYSCAADVVRDGELHGDLPMSAAATATPVRRSRSAGCVGELCIRWFSIHLSSDHPCWPAYDDAGKHPREQ